jgi:serine/threonine protein kinase
MLIRLLQTLRDCHALGVIHRDIKPDNVILRDGKLDSPMLIDFGLAFGDALGPSDHSTVTEQGVGNRILILPEQLADPAAKRDPVSDITQVVGLLFILLFNKAPISLDHPKGLKPHERFEWRSRLSNLEKWQLDQLAIIFSTGFEQDPAQRWPSAERLIPELEVLTLDSPPPPRSRSVEERIKQLAGQANNSTNQLLLRMETLGVEIHQAVLHTADKLYNAYTQHITLVHAPGTNWEPATRRYRFQLSLQARLKGTPAQLISYTLLLFGTDICLYREVTRGYQPFIDAVFPGKDQGSAVSPPPGHLLRVPAFDPRAKEHIQTVVVGSTTRTHYPNCY